MSISSSNYSFVILHINIMEGTKDTNLPPHMTLVIHAGAYTVPDFLLDKAREGSTRAAVVGWKVLLNGGSAVDAVEAAVADLENWPTFNAGKGSSLTIDQKIQMDAFIMDGRDLRIGAVAGVTSVRNPVKLSRVIMDKTEHCMFVGEKADQLAEKLGFELIDPEILKSDESFRRYNEFQIFKRTVDIGFRLRKEVGGENNQINGIDEGEHDTVGAVAVDRYGHVAAATSTGGLTAQMPGRVGDSPLSGCGGYADDACGAVSTTGHGEAILRVCLAHRCTESMRGDGVSPTEAAKEALSYLRSRIQGAAGLVAVDPKGNIGVEFITERMAWAYIRNNTMHWGVLNGEDQSRSLSDAELKSN